MGTTVASAEPLLRIRPATGWAAFNLRELLLYRDLLIVLAGRDVKLRYRQTVLGVAWVLFQPLLGAGILSFVFGVIAKLPTQGIPPFVFSYTGFLAYNVFSNTLTKSSSALISNSQLISKVYFPRLILPLSSTLSSLIDFLVGLLLMALFLVLYRIVPGVGLLLLPVWVMLLLLLAIGLGLIAGALMVSYRDVQYILPVLIPFLLYASPVGYSSSDVPARFRLVFLLNPLSGLLDASRWSLLGTGRLNLGSIAYSTAVSLSLFCAGTVLFKRMERRFADVI